MTPAQARSAFEHVVAGDDDTIDVARAALYIAAEDQHGVNPEKVMASLDELGDEAIRRVGAARGAEALLRLTDFLATELGFHGNEHDYYDPRNSWLDQVLTRRTGIPITLSLVWVEVGRRAGVRLHGVGFPGHFLARLDEPPGTVIDPFNGGAPLEAEALVALLRSVAGPGAELDPRLLAPARPRMILGRLLRNLKNIWSKRQDDEKLLATLDRILVVEPRAKDELRERGLLCAKLGGVGAAVRDLEHYLKIAPDAPDIEAVHKVLGRLRGRSVLLN